MKIAQVLGIDNPILKEKVLNFWISEKCMSEDEAHSRIKEALAAILDDSDNVIEEDNTSSTSDNYEQELPQGIDPLSSSTPKSRTTSDGGKVIHQLAYPSGNIKFTDKNEPLMDGLDAYIIPVSSSNE